MTSTQFSFAMNSQPHELSFANPMPNEMMTENLTETQKPKCSDEIILENANQEKKALMKQREKQQKLYKKILKTQSGKTQDSQSHAGESGQKKKSSYVTALIEKSKQILAQSDNKEELLQSARKILQSRDKPKRKKRTLTVSNPFELRTQKRVRLDIDESANVEPQQEYEPLWAQIKKSFRLRESEAKPEQKACKALLTKPRSPTLQTLERMKLKGDFQIASADKIYERSQRSDFKAMPFNKKAFENPFIPKKEKKGQITFSEFNLSKSNTKLGNKTLVEYQNNKENTSQNIFRAKSLDKKLFEKNDDKSPKTDMKPRRLTEFSPFNFKTDERISFRKQHENEESLNSKDGNSTNFKAREMPKYKFFEVKHDIKKQITFQEFQLATQKRLSSKKRSNSSEDKDQQQQFHALPMPDFSNLKPKTCLKKQTQQSQLEVKPFDFQTDARGREKQLKFQQFVEHEKKQAVDQAHFKAREFKIRFSDAVSDNSRKSRQNATPRIIPKEFKLQSQLRSRSRDEFNRKIREKEAEQLAQEAAIKDQKQKEVEDEIRKVREMAVFKATPIRKYKPVDGSKVAEKALTIPQMPKLSTHERAMLKDDVVMKD